MPMGFGYGYGLPFGGAMDTTPLMQAKFASDDAQYREGQRHQDEQNHTAIKALAGAAALAGIIYFIRRGGGKDVIQKMRNMLRSSARTQAEKNITEATKGMNSDQILKAISEAGVQKPSELEALHRSGKLAEVLKGKPQAEQNVIIAALRSAKSEKLTRNQQIIVDALNNNVPGDFVQKLTAEAAEGEGGKFSEELAKSVETYIKAAKADNKNIGNLIKNVPTLTEDELSKAYVKYWGIKATDKQVATALKTMNNGWYRRPGKFGAEIGNDATKNVDDICKKVKATKTPVVVEGGSTRPSAAAGAAGSGARTGAAKLNPENLTIKEIERIPDDYIVDVAEQYGINVQEINQKLNGKGDLFDAIRNELKSLVKIKEPVIEMPVINGLGEISASAWDQYLYGKI